VKTSEMRDKSGRVFGLIINLRDLSELQGFYEQMSRADRLATVGAFATGLAHDVRNPLGAIKGTAQLLAEDVKDNPRLVEFTKIIVQETNRLDELVCDVQQFSQPVAQKVPTDLNKLVSQTVAVARGGQAGSSGKGVSVVENLAALPTVHISADKIHQALLNVLINAFHAVDDGGIITVSTAHDPGEPLPVSVTVTNTGSRIETEDMVRLFEPFFTTKEQGTGLGLSITSQIVGHHRGTVQATNTRDGVAFTVRLPVGAEDDGLGA
jgi:two-component system sensor histidine kinase AtoS